MVYPIKINGFYRKFKDKTFDGLHLGIDFKSEINQEVKSISDGIVLDSREILGFGGLNPAIEGGAVFILHDNIIALYGHIKRLVFKNDIVKEGQIIGLINDFTNKDKINGFYHAPHLHFGVWNNNKMPPSPYGYNNAIGYWIDGIEFLKKGII